MSQRETVAGVLLEHGGITEGAAFQRNVRDVRKPVYQLRQAGWRIATCTGCGHPEGGHYILVQAPGEAPRQAGLGL